MIAAALVLILALLALSVPVGIAMFGTALVLQHFYSFLSLAPFIGESVWGTQTSFLLVAVPLFILLGEIMLRSGIADRTYAALTHWIAWLPGGLMHSNVGTCTLFAAVSGSSVATAATVGTVAIEQIERHGYNERFFLGTIAAGGTLGILIPPSINLIIYGAMTGTSIPKLFLAGFVPGFILSGLFMLTVVIACIIRPQWGGTRTATDWSTRWRSLPDLAPPLLIFLVVIGSIYLGWATPSESAALGVFMALVLAAWRRMLSLGMLRQAVEGTMRTSGMIMLNVIGAFYLSYVLGIIGLTTQVTALVIDFGLPPMGTLILVVIMYLVLGMFMEPLSMMVATVPIIVPVITVLGFDTIWFGVLMVLLMETGLITPPVGGNLFVVHGIRGRGRINDVMIGSLPFVVTLLAMIALLIAAPGIALWLPGLMR